MALATQEQSTAVVKHDFKAPVKSRATLESMLHQFQGQIAAALPKHMTPERMIRVALSATSRNPKLLECTAASLIGAIVQSSQLGLECDGLLGQAYLVPFNNKIKGRNGQDDYWRMECQLIPGYKGLLKLARNTGEISTVQAFAVYKGDHFKFMRGLNPVLEYTPGEGTDHAPGNLTHAVFIVNLKDGGVQFEVMDREAIERVRKGSKNGKFGPWADHYEAMAIKTVIRRCCKLLPASAELERAVALDERGESGQWQNLGSIEVLPAELADDFAPDEEDEPEPIQQPQRKGAKAKPEIEVLAAVIDTEAVLAHGKSLNFSSERVMNSAEAVAGGIAFDQIPAQYQAEIIADLDAQAAAEKAGK